MQKIYFKTFGCRTNLFDTQVMMGAFGAHQIIQNEALADVIIINSCTVTNGADSAVRQYVSKIRTSMPHTRLLFTGCGVDSLGAKLLSDGKIDGLFGHSEKSKVNIFANNSEIINEIGTKDYIDEDVNMQTIGKTRAHIKVQEGCDFACSYCIIPSVRGKSRSLKLETILENAYNAVEAGYSELILTGTNVGSFENLPSLIVAIGKIKQVKRVRLGSIEPCQITQELLEVAQESYFAKHLHIALQHTHDKILELMNRRNNFKSDYILLEKIADMGFSVGTDFIVGFPYEDGNIWQETKSRLESLPLTHIHPFVFSPRQGTIAATMKSVPSGDVSKLRLHEINQIIKDKNLQFRQKKHTLEVSVEESSGGFDQFYNWCEVPNVAAKTWLNISDYNVLEDYNQAT